MTLQNRILDYAVVLCDAAAKTKFANSRSEYAGHMATALGWLAQLHAGGNEENVKQEIFKQERVYGWSSLGGENGRDAEEAFGRLLKSL